MKTLKDLEIMKNKNCSPFGTQYDYFLEKLKDCYISKLDGISRIKTELQDWNEETKQFIISDLVESIVKSEPFEFDKNELLSLLK